MDDLRIRVSATLNHGKAIGNINESIRAIEKHPSLRKIKLKVDIDPKILQTLSTFNSNLNKINQTMGQQSKEVDNTTSAINRETEAINRITSAQKKWRIEQEKISQVTGKQTVILGDTQSNSKQIVKQAGDGSTIDIIDITNQKKDLQDYNRMLDQAYRENEKFNKRVEALDRAHYQALRTEQARKEAQDKMHYLALKQNREIDLKAKQAQLKQSEALDRAHYMALKTDQERRLAQDKMHVTALEQNRQRDLRLQKQYNTLRNSMDVQSQRLLLNPFSNKSSVNAIVQELNSFNRVTPQTITRTKELQQQLRLLGVEAQAAGVRTNTMAGAFRNAMVKFPIWMGASTAFFGTLRGIRTTLENIIEIDKQMTVLQRVSGGEIDRNHILRESIDLAERLGNTILDINEGLSNFARQGFRGEGLIAMTEAATLFSNISEMTVEEASSGLTAALKGFQILPEEAMRVVDAVNEVDNNFAISSQNIVLSMQKSVGAAQTFGVTMEELIGMTVAIGETTRESGNIIGNSLKTIFSRITTMGGSIEALENIGVAVKTIEDGVQTVRPVADIIEDLAVKWQDLNAEQQQSIGLQIAGR